MHCRVIVATLKLLHELLKFNLIKFKLCAQNLFHLGQFSKEPYHTHSEKFKIYKLQMSFITCICMHNVIYYFLNDDFVNCNRVNAKIFRCKMLTEAEVSSIETVSVTKITSESPSYVSC